MQGVHSGLFPLGGAGAGGGKGSIQISYFPHGWESSTSSGTLRILHNGNDGAWSRSEPLSPEGGVVDGRQEGGDGVDPGAADVRVIGHLAGNAQQPWGILEK